MLRLLIGRTQILDTALRPARSLNSTENNRRQYNTGRVGLTVCFFINKFLLNTTGYDTLVLISIRIYRTRCPKKRHPFFNNSVIN